MSRSGKQNTREPKQVQQINVGEETRVRIEGD